MDDEKGIRINKYLSECGVCSRRECDKHISDKHVIINGSVANLGDRVFPNDEVIFEGKTISKTNENVYIAFNKPIGVTCTTDEKIKSNIISYINFKSRIFPIGRLDRNSEGLILLTNDGDIVNKILRQQYNHEKEYVVVVDNLITDEFIESLSAGVNILGVRTKPCTVVKQSDNCFNITLTQGLNRQIRRMCDVFGYDVVSLKRIRIMNIHISGLKLGTWRTLTPEELSELKNSFV